MIYPHSQYRVALVICQAVLAILLLQSTACRQVREKADRPHDLLRVHVVWPGDSLAIIAEKRYVTNKKNVYGVVEEVLKANKDLIAHGRGLTVGDFVVLPEIPGVAYANCPGPAYATMRDWADSLPGLRRSWDELVREVNAESDALEEEHKAFTAALEKEHKAFTAFNIRRHEIGEPIEMERRGRMVVVYRIEECGCTGNQSCDVYFESSTGWVGPYRFWGLDADNEPIGFLANGYPVWRECMKLCNGDYTFSFLTLDPRGRWRRMASWKFLTGGEDSHGFSAVTREGCAPTTSYLQFIRHPMTRAWMGRDDFSTQWCLLRLDPSGRRLMAAVEYEPNLPADAKPEPSRARLWSYEPGRGYTLMEECWIKREHAEQWHQMLYEADYDRRTLTEADWRWLVVRAEKQWEPPPEEVVEELWK